MRPLTRTRRRMRRVTITISYGNRPVFQKYKKHLQGFPDQIFLDIFIIDKPPIKKKIRVIFNRGFICKLISCNKVLWDQRIFFLVGISFGKTCFTYGSMSALLRTRTTAQKFTYAFFDFFSAFFYKENETKTTTIEQHYLAYYPISPYLTHYGAEILRVFDR